MDVHILANGTLAILIALAFLVTAIATWRMGRWFAPGASLLLFATFLRFSGRFARRGGGPDWLALDQEWIITVNYTLVLVAVVGVAAEAVWVRWKYGRQGL